MIKNINNEEFLQYIIDLNIIDFYWETPGDTIILSYDKITIRVFDDDYFYYNLEFTTSMNDFRRSKAGALNISILHDYLSEKRNQKLELIKIK